MNDERIPVVIGVGQSIERDETVSALDMAERAGRAALDDAAGIGAAIDRVSLVNVVSSHGQAPATDLAARLGLSPTVCETTVLGGNTPQLLVNRASDQVSRGELTATMIVGAEAQRSVKTGVEVDLGGYGDRPDPEFGIERLGMGDAELGVALLVPAHLYAMIDSALAASAGRTMSEHRHALGELFAPFTDVAAKHPFAWFPESVSADELATVTNDNRVVAEPYTKRLCAFFNVDQGAALIVCSLAAARRAGLADQAVFTWAGADVNDVWEVSARPDIAASPAIAAAANGVLSAAGLGIDEIDLLDLYSCFPAAVQIAAAESRASASTRPLTLTGGLPYFGGPGNNYTTHAIATAVERLREGGSHALIGALGWFVTKHSYGLYGSEPSAEGYTGVDCAHVQDEIDVSARTVVAPGDDVSGSATVVAATLVPDREGNVATAPAFADLPDGRRVVAQAADPDSVPVDLVGQEISTEGQTYRMED